MCIYQTLPSLYWASRRTKRLHFDRALELLLFWYESMFGHRFCNESFNYMKLQADIVAFKIASLMHDVTEHSFQYGILTLILEFTVLEPP